MAYTRVPNVTVYGGGNVQFTGTNLSKPCQLLELSPVNQTITSHTACNDFFPYIWKAKEGTYNFRYQTTQGGPWTDDIFTVLPEPYTPVNVELDINAGSRFVHYLHDNSVITFGLLSIIVFLLLFTTFTNFFNRKI
jgi:hypothetical protein